MIDPYRGGSIGAIHFPTLFSVRQYSRAGSVVGLLPLRCGFAWGEARATDLGNRGGFRLVLPVRGVHAVRI